MRAQIITSESPGRGRHLVASEEVPAGGLILTSSPFEAVLYDDQFSRRCARTFTADHGLLRCGRCYKNLNKETRTTSEPPQEHKHLVQVPPSSLQQPRSSARCLEKWTPCRVQRAEGVRSESTPCNGSAGSQSSLEEVSLKLRMKVLSKQEKRPPQHSWEVCCVI